jgi:hypothetical protein
MSTASSCRHQGKGDGNGGPPRRQLGHGRRALPLILNPQEAMRKRMTKMEKKVK